MPDNTAHPKKKKGTSSCGSLLMLIGRTLRYLFIFGFVLVMMMRPINFVWQAADGIAGIRSNDRYFGFFMIAMWFLLTFFVTYWLIRLGLSLFASKDGDKPEKAKRSPSSD